MLGANSTEHKREKDDPKNPSTREREKIKAQ
jgi:hypothetical protein